MKGYELIFITNPDVIDKDLKDDLKKFKKSLKDSGGKLMHEHVWGRRRLAYEIEGNEYGVYHAWYFTGGGKTVDELQRQFGYADNILRNQIVKTDDIDKESVFLEELINKKDKSSEIQEIDNISDDLSSGDLDKSLEEDLKTDKKEVESVNKKEVEFVDKKEVEFVDKKEVESLDKKEVESEEKKEVESEEKKEVESEEKKEVEFVDKKEVESEGKKEVESEDKKEVESVDKKEVES